MDAPHALDNVIRRTRLCAAGYLVSTIVASFAIVSVLIGLEQLKTRSFEDLRRLPGSVFSFLFFAWPEILYATIMLTILPSAVFILVAELAGFHRRPAYIAFGAVLGPALLFYLSGQVPSGDEFFLVAIAVGAGAFAGFAYWWVAIQRPLSQAMRTVPSPSE